MLSSLNGHAKVATILSVKAEVDNALEDGLTALMIASGRGHLKVVELLIDTGANVQAVKTGRVTTSLMFACLKGHLEVVKLLIEKRPCFRLGMPSRSPMPSDAAHWRKFSEKLRNYSLFGK